MRREKFFERVGFRKNAPVMTQEIALLMVCSGARVFGHLLLGPYLYLSTDTDENFSVGLFRLPSYNDTFQGTALDLHTRWVLKQALAKLLLIKKEGYISHKAVSVLRVPSLPQKKELKC